jgi:predicted nucleic acid-binding protein
VIVVDTNIILYLLLPNEKTQLAEELRARLPHWVAPPLWRSECRNALALYLRKSLISIDEAIALQIAAEEIMTPGEVEVSSRDVLTLASQSGRSAYDCEFVAVARSLDSILVTEDEPLRKAFPDTAISLQEALGRF